MQQCVMTLGADFVGMAPNKCDVGARIAAKSVLNLYVDMAPNECNA